MEQKKPARKPDDSGKNGGEDKRLMVSFSLSRRMLIIIAAAVAAVLLIIFVLVPNLQKAPEEQKPAGEEPKAQATVVDFTAEEMDVSGVDLAGQVIIVDAGHGGSDSGSLAAGSGKPEKEINLEVANKVKENLEKEGATVIMTRTTDDALGATKEDDFVARENIIKAADADMFISIHMNEYDSADASGPQVFFLKQGAVGKRLATAIQDMLNYTMKFEYPRMALPADYRVLRTGAQPSCTVECGFLSNPEEGALLQTDEYQQQLADCIADGAKLYLKRYADILEQEAQKKAAAEAAASSSPAASSGPAASGSPTASGSPAASSGPAASSSPTASGSPTQT